MPIERDDPQFREKFLRMQNPTCISDYGMSVMTEDVREVCPDLYEKFIAPWMPDPDPEISRLARHLGWHIRTELDRVIWEGIVAPADEEDDDA